MKSSQLIIILQKLMDLYGDQDIHLDEIGWELADISFVAESNRHGIVLYSKMPELEPVLVGAAGE